MVDVTPSILNNNVSVSPERSSQDIGIGGGAASAQNAEKARIWAEGNDNQVERLGGEHSAKGWAEVAEDIATGENVQTIVDNIEDINTIATNIQDVNTVSQSISSINNVSDNMSDVNSVGSNITDIAAVATISSDVTQVASIASAVSTVAAHDSDVTLVSDNMASVMTTASSIGDVNTVAGISTDVSVVADNNSNVTAVAGNATNINTVANNISNVNTVASNSSNINTVSGNNANITTVATNISNINAVASDLTNIDNASTYANNAANSATNAATSATNAQKWAEGTDSEVQPLGGTHSSKGWADRAQEIVDSIGTVLHYKGSVATYADLPSTGNVIGDVWNVLDDGSNYAWDGTGWDKLSGTVDLSAYRTAAAQDVIDATKQATLVSGTNIKTVNGNSLLGSGNIDALPSQAGNSGKFLTTDGTAASWANVDALPTQTGQSGKFLTTDGADASWANLPTDVEWATYGTTTYQQVADWDTANKIVLVKYANDIFRLSKLLGGEAYFSNSGGATYYSITVDAVTNIWAYSTVSLQSRIPAGTSGEVLTYTGTAGSVGSATLPTTMTGADGINAGTSGLVPAPAATDNTKFLKGDGTWAAAGSTYTAGTGIDITAGTISVKSPTLTNGNSSNWGLSLLNTQNNVGCITIGSSGSSSSAGYSTAVGYSAKATGKLSSAYGTYASATAVRAIQIGDGTNSTGSTLSIGFGSNLNYQLLDGTTGLIPTARLSAFTGADGANAGAKGAVPAPTATDNTKFLRGDGTWSAVDALPSQTSQSGKFLTTDGTTPSWANIPAGVSADGTTIEDNSNVFTTIGVKDQKTSNANKMWTGTKAEYDAIVTKDANTFYHITDDEPNTVAYAKADLSNLTHGLENTICTTPATTTSTATSAKPAVVVENYVNGTSWYRVYSDGWCEQGGYVNNNTDYITVTLLKPFADTSYSVLTTAQLAGQFTATAWVVSKTSSDIVIKAQYWQNASYTGTVSDFYWRAEGYIA